MRMVFVIAALAAVCVLPASPGFAQENDKPPSLEEYNDVPASLAMPSAPGATEAGETSSSLSRGDRKLSYDDLLRMYKRAEYTAVAKELEPLAKGGREEAKELLGIMYRMGQGVRRDLDRAFTLLMEAAAAGRPLAEYHIATMYYAGDGTEKDYITALKWLEISIVHYADGQEKNQALESRDILYKQLTRRERERARQMAREWLTKKGEAHLLDMEQ
jgi:hypothetical protein